MDEPIPEQEFTEEEKKRQAEAILFACGQKISIDDIARLMNLKGKDALFGILNDLKKSYEERGSPMMIISDQEGFWKMTVRERYLGLVREISPHTELSKTILETLAVIAWKQPILQSEVIAFRTNKAYDHITELESMGFIMKEKHGRSYLIKLTQKFFEYFDLEDDAKLRGLFAGVKDEGEIQQKIVEFAKALNQERPLLLEDKTSQQP